MKRKEKESIPSPFDDISPCLQTTMAVFFEPPIFSPDYFFIFCYAPHKRVLHIFPPLDIFLFFVSLFTAKCVATNGVFN